MSLRGHLCYRDHLSFSTVLSLSPRLEADRLFRCLIFNASCLLSEVAVTVGSCHIDMYLARRKSERAHHHRHRRPPGETCGGLLPVSAPGKFARAVLLVRALIPGGISMTREEGVFLERETQRWLRGI